MKPGWEKRFAAMQAKARELAKPRPGERLYSLQDLLANPDLPDGTQMDAAFMDGLVHGSRQTMLLKGLNAYVDFPNVLRRRSTDDGEEWSIGLTPEEIRAARRYCLAVARAGRDADLPAVGSFHG